MASIALALTNLPTVGQAAIVRHADAAYRHALAASPHLDPSTADALTRCSSNAASTVWYAIRKIVDQDRLVAYMATGSSVRAAAAARNPLAPLSSLVDLLGRTDNAEVQTAVLVSGRIPVDVSRAVATPATLDRLVHVNRLLAHETVRAVELVLANPWIGDDPGAYPKVFHRALAAAPSTPTETLTALRSFSRSGSKWVARHPLLLEPGTTWSSFTVDQLVSFEHPAADLVALERLDCTATHAASMLSRTERHVEPHVMVRLLQRFGFAPAAAAPAMSALAGTRTSAATWSHPCAQFLENWTPETSSAWFDATAAVEQLGTDPDHWEVFVSLLPRWQLDLTALAATAHKLGR